MKYIEKYNRYIDDDLVIYRMNKEGKLVQVKPSVNKCGYEFICYAPSKTVYVHRLVFEAFNGEIADGMEIDHINTIKTDNRLVNLRLVTHQENMCNPLTRSKRKGLTRSEEVKRKMSKAHKGRIWSEFGTKFKEHFGLTFLDNINLYYKERNWYRKHNKKCSWE